MSSNTILTMVAYVLDIQKDLQQHILEQLSDQISIKELFFHKELYSKVYDRHKNENDSDDESGSVTCAQLVEFIDLGDAVEILNKHRSHLSPSLGEYIQSATGDLEALVPIRNRLMHGRPLRPGDWAELTDKVHGFIQQKLYWPKLCQCVDRLDNDPSFILNLRIPAESHDDSVVEHNLPRCDFEETGFLGRGKELESIRNHLLGPWPVITVIGEGGVGKTAIALKVAYDLLDDDNCPFEHIVWTSCKTAQLTPQGIRNIDGAISDSLGMLKATGEQLFGSSETVTDEILEYLEEFKILLIIDNLETVLDARIVEFLRAYQGRNSKFLITSRVGLGELEFPEKLGPFGDNDAVELLRKFARVRKVADIVKANNKTLTNYCRRMKNNPLWIKWFVELVQLGRRPEEALANTSDFMEFAFANVYGNLSDECCEILDVLVTAPGEHGQAELAYLTNQDVHTIESSLADLLRTSMLRRNTTMRSGTYETTYVVPDISRKYLLKVSPIAPKRQEDIIKRNKQMMGAIEENTEDHKSDPYNKSTIRTRNKSDAVIANSLRQVYFIGTRANKCLRKAEDPHSHFDETQRNEYRESGTKLLNQAKELITKCMQLAPAYFEVYRMEAWCQLVGGNINGARDAYEKAIEVEPQWAPVRVYYGGFLYRFLEDPANARKQFEAANEIDKDNPNILAEIANLDNHEGHHLRSQNILEGIVNSGVGGEHIKRKCWTIYIDSFGRRADSLTRSSDFGKALDALCQMRLTFERCPRHFIDKRLVIKLSKRKHTIGQLIRQIYDQDQIKILNDIMGWISEKEKQIEDAVDSKIYASPTEDRSKSVGSKPYASPTEDHSKLLVESHKVYVGVIRTLVREQNFGFIEMFEAEVFYRNIFFHRSDFVQREDWDKCTVSDSVSFLIMSSEKGVKAVNIQLQGKD